MSRRPIHTAQLSYFAADAGNGTPPTHSAYTPAELAEVTAKVAALTRGRDLAKVAMSADARRAFAAADAAADLARRDAYSAEAAHVVATHYIPTPHRIRITPAVANEMTFCIVDTVGDDSAPEHESFAAKLTSAEKDFMGNRIIRLTDAEMNWLRDRLPMECDRLDQLVAANYGESYRIARNCFRQLARRIGAKLW